MRVPFDSVFKVNPDGSITPLTIVQIGCVTLSPNRSFSNGAVFSGLNIGAMRGKDLNVQRTAVGLILEGFFP